MRIGQMPSDFGLGALGTTPRYLGGGNRWLTVQLTGRDLLSKLWFLRKSRPFGYATLQFRALV